MASYMPSFMSKNLSTGAGAAYGQPFAFTTGPNAAANTETETTPKSTEDKKKRKRKPKSKVPQQPSESKEIKDAKENKGEKNQNATRKPKKILLTPEHTVSMKDIKMKYIADQGKACQMSVTYEDLQQAFSNAKISENQQKIAIFLQYPDAEKIVKKLQKHITHLQNEDKRDVDSRPWKQGSFYEYKQILADFYSEELQAMRIMMKATAEKRSAYSSFFDRFPDLKPASRANARDAEKV